MQVQIGEMYQAYLSQSSINESNPFENEPSSHRDIFDDEEWYDYAEHFDQIAYPPDED